MTSPLSHAPVGSNAIGPSEQARWARYANALLGLWLFISAFVWSHTPSSRINTCLVGLFIGVSAITATGWAIVRRVTMVLAFWLAFSTAVAYPARPATFWNNMIVALVVLVLSAIPHRPRRPKPLVQ